MSANEMRDAASLLRACGPMPGAIAEALADWLDAEAAMYDALDEMSVTMSSKGFKVSVPHSTQREAERVASAILEDAS